MRVQIIIPARYASTRYPGKPLVTLTGATGVERSLIARSWDAACQVKGADQIAVATDNDRIADHARMIGADVIMTSSACRNGTERCADTLPQLPDTPDIVVNLQGDAPLTPPWFVDALIDELKANPDVQVATPVLRCDAATLAGFVEDRQAGRVGGTTTVFSHARNALYFSKEVIPYTGRSFTDDETVPVFHHVGVYAYRPAALKAYMQWPEGALEKWEGLEQLRFMEHDTPVRCVEVDAKGHSFWELNNPVDVPRIEAILKARGQA